MMRAVGLAAILCLLSGGAMAQQTCTTRADGSFNCTTTPIAAATPAAAPAATTGPKDRRRFEPDDSGLLRVPTIEGEMLFHCDNVGPCKELGLNPLPANR
jgi:hypothetical protein